MKYLKKFENFELGSFSQEENIVEGLSAKQKKLPKALQDAILKKKGKKVEDKKVEDKKEDKKEPKKGLTTAQKKLPKALQDAILKNKNK